MAKVIQQVLTLSYDDQHYVRKMLENLEEGELDVFTIRVEGFDITCGRSGDVITSWVTKNEWRSD